MAARRKEQEGVSHRASHEEPPTANRQPPTSNQTSEPIDRTSYTVNVIYNQNRYLTNTIPFISYVFNSSIW